jgi:hypothetical protein
MIVETVIKLAMDISTKTFDDAECDFHHLPAGIIHEILELFASGVARVSREA